MTIRSLSNRRLVFAFGAAVAVLLVVGAFSYRGLVVSRESDRWVRHSHEVLENLDELLFAVASIESSSRGFVLTGEDSYLASDHANISSAEQHLAAVRKLTVELTESALMRHADSAASILKALRDKGVRVAIDDFGTGYSSLSYLRKFPLDALKIDQSFVNQISTAGDATTIVTAVIAMARNLELRVIAEGAETAEVVAFLRAHQCDEAQGYYFSRPVPPQQFATLLETGIPETDCVSGRAVSSEHGRANVWSAGRDAALAG